MQIASDRVMRPRESGNSMAGREEKEGGGSEGGAAAGQAIVERARPESEVEAEKVAFKVSFLRVDREGRERMASPVQRTTTTKKNKRRREELS